MSFRISQFVVIHMVKSFGIVSEAEIDVFLEFPCLFYDPTDLWHPCFFKIYLVHLEILNSGTVEA